jgi:Helix-turn-helix domain
MIQGKRVALSAAQRTELWSRWKAGESLHTIGRAFGKPHNSIHGFLSQHGGIVPAVRRRSLLVLTAVEREDISRGLASGSSMRDVAKALERAASPVSREVARHGGRPEYRAQEADQRAWDSALRPKRCLLAIHLKLRKLVASKLILDWSPQQISGWLKIQYPADESMRVSHETIYRSLFIQARGVLKKELLGHLRSKRRIRRSQHSRIFKDSRGQIVDAISIRERPAEIEDRAGTRTLGRRSHWRHKKQPYRDVGGTAFAFYGTGQGTKQRQGCGRRRTEPANSQAAHNPAALVDVGSRAGDG